MTIGCQNEADKIRNRVLGCFVEILWWTKNKTTHTHTHTHTHTPHTHTHTHTHLYIIFMIVALPKYLQRYLFVNMTSVFVFAQLICLGFWASTFVLICDFENANMPGICMPDNTHTTPIVSHVKVLMTAYNWNILVLTLMGCVLPAYCSKS